MSRAYPDRLVTVDAGVDVYRLRVRHLGGGVAEIRFVDERLDPIDVPADITLRTYQDEEVMSVCGAFFVHTGSSYDLERARDGVLVAINQSGIYAFLRHTHTVKSEEYARAEEALPERVGEETLGANERGGCCSKF